MHEGSPFVEIYIFDSGSEDSSRGHIRVSVEYIDSENQWFQLQPRSPSDHVSGDLLLRMILIESPTTLGGHDFEFVRNGDQDDEESATIARIGIGTRIATLIHVILTLA